MVKERKIEETIETETTTETETRIETETKKIINNYKIKIKPELDQHFLIDETIIKKIKSALELNKDDVLLEIGAGLAITTKEIAEKINEIIIIEIDKEFFPIIKKQLTDYNFKLIQKSAYKYLQDLISEQKKLKIKEQLKMYSNLPFTAIESIFLILPKIHFEKAIFIIPESYFNKIIGDIVYEAFFNIKLLQKIEKTSFYPAPDTDSVLIEVTPFKETKDYADFLIRELYLQKDKKTKNALREIIIRFTEEYLQKKATKRETKEILALISINQLLLEKDVSKLTADEFKAIITELIEHVKKHLLII